MHVCEIQILVDSICYMILKQEYLILLYPRYEDYNRSCTEVQVIITGKTISPFQLIFCIKDLG